MKKVLIVFGTRPEAIKMSPLVREFQKNSKLFETKICVTAQHREMLDQVLELFDIIPDYDLDIMKPGQDLFAITSNVLLGLKSVMLDFNPDIVFVHGDTSTTFAASLAAFYQQTTVAHIEAGLRTGDIYSPWPEEANRKLTTQITKFFFAPTLTSKNNLLKENINSENIVITGNTVIDALFITLAKIKSSKKLELDIIKDLKNNSYELKKNKKIILVTGHRRENHGQGFTDICNALREIALSNSDIDIVYPVHLNPNVQKPVQELLNGIENVYLIKPLQYEQFVYMMEKSLFIITDSGGVQEEAPSIGKPVLVMRNTTERPEALEAGTVKLVGTNTNRIIEQAQLLISNREFYENMSKASNPYGNGSASVKIVSYIKNNL